VCVYTCACTHKHTCVYSNSADQLTDQCHIHTAPAAFPSTQQDKESLVMLKHLYSFPPHMVLQHGVTWISVPFLLFCCYEWCCSAQAWDIAFCILSSLSFWIGPVQKVNACAIHWKAPCAFALIKGLAGAPCLPYSSNSPFLGPYEEVTAGQWLFH
jgi:hypothetical protein